VIKARGGNYGGLARVHGWISWEYFVGKDLPPHRYKVLMSSFSPGEAGPGVCFSALRLPQPFLWSGHDRVRADGGAG
jgi:hypothetical protein